MGWRIIRNRKGDIFFLTWKIFWTSQPWYFLSASSYALVTLTRMRLGLFSSLSPSAKLCSRICIKRSPLQEKHGIHFVEIIIQPSIWKFNMQCDQGALTSSATSEPTWLRLWATRPDARPAQPPRCPAGWRTERDPSHTPLLFSEIAHLDWECVSELHP